MSSATAHSPAPPDALRRRGLSIAQKLIALFALTSCVIVMLLTSFFLTQQLQDSRAALERKAAAYGRLVAKEVASAIAFNDQQTAREVFDSVAQDHDIESMLLMKASGNTLHTLGTPGAWVAAARSGVVEQRLVDLGERIGVVTPVVSAEGPRGTLVIELSTRELVLGNRRQMRTAVLVAVLSLAFGAGLAFWIARSLHRRLAQISRVATAVTSGQLEHAPVTPSGNDEITVLAHAFNAMLAHIQTLVQQIRQSADEQHARLESLVRVRTEELNGRNTDMRLVLDNVDQGFVGVDLAGELAAERSAMITHWLSEPAAGDTLFTWIERSFPEHGELFRVAWDQLSTDWMPLAMRIDQLPHEIRTRTHCFTFAYKPVLEGTELSKLLVVMTDITAVVEKRRAEEEERELAQIVRKLLEDRAGFRDFVAEADELVTAIVGDAHGWRRMRLLHTLKGNAAVFGFASLARLCNDIESAVQERETGSITRGELELLESSWSRVKDKATQLTETRRAALEVSEGDYAHLLECIDAHVPPARLRELVTTWTLEPVEARLARLAEYAQSLAERLDKAPVVVTVESNGVRLDPHAWAPIWQALVHVVRNAVDHGLETRAERAAAHKPETAALTLRTTLEGSRFVLEVADQGRGIDWELVARAAKRRGLSHLTPEQLRDALLVDGLSTRDEATDTSGRGVGLSAVKHSCASTGGRLQITSERGQGTRFSFEWTIDSAYRPVVTSGEDTNQTYGKAG